MILTRNELITNLLKMPINTIFYPEFDQQDGILHMLITIPKREVKALGPKYPYVDDKIDPIFIPEAGYERGRVVIKGVILERVNDALEELGIPGYVMAGHPELTDEYCQDWANNWDDYWVGQDKLGYAVIEEIKELFCKNIPIKEFSEVEVGDMAMENPHAGGEWLNEQGEITWKGSLEQLKKEHPSFYEEFTQDDGIITEVDHYDIVIVDVPNYGKTAFNYNCDPSGVVVYKS